MIHKSYYKLNIVHQTDYMYKVHKVTNKAAPLSDGQTSIKYVQNYLWTAGITPPGQQLFITALSLKTLNTAHCSFLVHMISFV